MHGSGIEVDSELKSAWASLDASVALLRVKIADEKFKVDEQVTTTGSWSDDWAAMVAKLAENPKEPVYNLIRAEDSKDKFVFVPYVPDNAYVRTKMLYASSQGALKSGLGSAKFSNEFSVSSPGEASLDNFREATVEIKREDMMTWDEQEAAENHIQSHMAMGDTSAQAIVNVALDMTDDLSAAIKSFNSGTLVMGVEDGKEQLKTMESSQDSLDEAAKRLPLNLPRYLLHDFHAADGSQHLVFVYYCPAKAKPRSRMFYSTCKANVLQVIEALGLDTPKRFEFDSTEEVSQQELQSQLFPPVEVKKKMSKPKPRGKAKFRGAKFQA